MSKRLTDYTHPLTRADTSEFLKYFWENVRWVRKKEYGSMVIDVETMEACRKPE